LAIEATQVTLVMVPDHAASMLDQFVASISELYLVNF
jgi:hypothetical protein